jgi:hypothetical protein
MPQPVREHRSPTESNWFRIAAVVWLAIYFVAFFSQDLPNSNPRVSRAAVASETPFLLLDLIDPPRPATDYPQAIAIRERTGWRFFPQRLDLLLVAAIVIAGAWGGGHLALRVERLPLSSHCLEREVFAVGLGLSLLSLVTLGAGLVGWLSRPLLGGALVAVVAGECWLRVRATNPLAPLGRADGGEGRSECSCDSSHSAPLPKGNGRSFWVAVSAPFLLCILLGAMLPSTDFDANEYHLQGPKEFFQNGRITFLSHNVYTSFPFGTEMLTLLTMVLRGDWYRGALAGKAVLACFGPLTALAIFAAGRRWFGSVAGGLAAFVYVSTPWVYRISTIAGAEGGLCCFLFLALFAALRAVEARSGEDGGWRMEDRGSRQRLWLLAGLFAGSAMTCKYPGVLSVVIPLGIVAVVAAWQGSTGGSFASVSRAGTGGKVPVAHDGLRPLMCFAIGTAITVGPWLAKNVIETGNPVYPLMYRVVVGRDWDDDLNSRWVRGHRPDNFSPSDLVEKFVDVTTRSDWLSPLLFGLAPLALVHGATRRRVGWLWAYVGYLFLTWWLFTHRIDRFWVPLIPVVSLLAGVGAAWLIGSRVESLAPLAPLVRGVWGEGPTERSDGPSPQPSPQRRDGAAESGSGAWRRLMPCLIGGVIFLVSLFNLAFITTPLCNFNAFLLDLNLARKLAVQVTAPEIAYLNEHLPPGSKVLCVGEAQVFDAEFPLIYNTVFDRSIFEEWCGESPHGGPAASRPLRDPAAIRQTLRHAGVTHVLVNWSEILRYRTTYGYTDFVTPERFARLQQAGVLGQPWDIPFAIREVSSLDKSWRDEVDRWGRGLLTTDAGKTAIVTIQVFSVEK